MLETLLLLFTALYALQICVFAFGAHRAHYVNDPSFRPTVSVIIAARNEEQTIRPCLESIARLTYPKELLEVIVVNDRSTDNTEAVVQEFAALHPFITLLNAREDETGRLKGKTNAVAQAIDRSRGDFILFTDADCIVPEAWVEETVKYYSEENVGLVAGFTSLRAQNVFEGIQALDWFVLFSVAAATIRLHFPVTAVGNNLSVRKKAYEAVGGYRSIPFSITEDYALFNAITSTRTYKAKFPLDAGMLVQSLPCDSVEGLFKQKKRWFIGGADMSFERIMLFANGFIFKALLILSFIISGVGSVLIPFAVKCIVDFLLVRPSLSAFKKMHLLTYFILFELYYIAYVVLFPLLVLFNRKVAWKERTF
jgi:cellulose synthase/poly-beta-1,6-N-acetylglucosamine synthase-like glycosyltransferase